MRWINGGVPVSREDFDTELWPVLTARDAEWPVLGFWAACERESGLFLGWVSLRRNSGIEDVAELGYRFARAAWGKGYAVEAARAIIAAAFESTPLNRVVATTYQENLASQRVMQKLGMTFLRAFRLTAEDLAHEDTHVVDGSDIWDGDDVEYELAREQWSGSS
jgi:RimJ/RimL family protein N-acetyltransferase